MNLSEPLAEGVLAEVFPWQEGKIVKLARHWIPTDWVDNEYRIARLVHAAGVSVPEPFARVEVAGRSGIVFADMNCRTMWSHIYAAPHKLLAFARTLGRLHADLHGYFGSSDLPDVHDCLRRRIESVRPASPEIRQPVLDKLNTLPHGDRLLHGDFHPGNVMMSRTGPVIIDWAGALRGHPLADVAQTSLLIRAGGFPRHPVLWLLAKVGRNVFHRVYLSAYFRESPYSREDLQSWLIPVRFIGLNWIRASIQAGMPISAGERSKRARAPA